MLPKLSQSGLSRRTRNYTDQNTLSAVQQSRVSHQQWQKGVKQIKNIEDKLDQEITLNKKLNSLYAVLKQNLDRNSLASDEEQELSNLLKQRKKYQLQYQNQCRMLNSLMSDNSKLKDQVNMERNKRAIYFNIYKNLEHQIQIWERKYKNQLVETLKAEGVMAKMKQKFGKSHKKMKKEIQRLNKDIQNCVNGIQNVESNEKTEDNEYSRVSKEKKTLKGFIFKERRQSKIHVQMEDQSLGTVPVSNKITEEQEEYLLEQRKLNTNGALQKIKTIFQINQLHQIKQCWSQIDKKTQQLYEQIEQQHKKDKKLTSDIQNMQAQVNNIKNAHFEKTHTIKQQKDKFVEIDNKKNQVKELQKRIGEAIGINVAELENDMMLHHCLRVKQDKLQRKQGKKNLQKFLQQSKKNKVECSVLLSPKQMHKILVENQAAGRQTGMYNN